MKTARLSVALVAVLFALSLTSVFAQYSPTPVIKAPVPILGATGSPALVGNQFSDVFNVLYADGQHVTLASNYVVMKVCASTCVELNVPITQTAPGTYSYTFTPPSSVNGTVTIFIIAGGLADDYGKIFPPVDTQIGAYSTPTSSSAQVPETRAPQPPFSYPGQVAVATTPPVGSPSSTTPLVELFSVLTLLGIGLLVFPSRH